LFSVLSLTSTLNRNVSTKPLQPPTLEVDPVSDVPIPGSVEMSLSDGEVVHVDEHPLLVLEDFTSARVVQRGSGVVLDLQVSPAAAERLHAYTAANVGKRLAILRDGHLLQAPRIRVAIEGRGLEVGPMDASIARELARWIGPSA